MPVTIVLGGQFGDEGKGQIVDMLARESQIVARATGGSNAGHTVINDHGTFAVHLIPSGIFTPGTTLRARQWHGDRPANPAQRDGRPHRSGDRPFPSAHLR